MADAPMEKDFDQLAHSVWYECGTLISQGLLYLREGQALAADKERLYPTADALLESLLTKLRALDDFFGNKRSGNPKYAETDAIARDLAPEWDNARFLSDEEWQSISARLAHLTYLRDPQQAWQIGRMIREALETMERFIQAAGIEKIYAGEYRLNEIRETLDRWEWNDVETWPDHHAERR